MKKAAHNILGSIMGKAVHGERAMTDPTTRSYNVDNVICVVRERPHFIRFRPAAFLSPCPKLVLLDAFPRPAVER
jgi:hypothetical protein